MNKIIIRPEGPAKKIILLPFCPKKYFGPDQKPKPPPPEYQMDRALPTLQYSRLRADIIETYKILNSIDIVDSDNLFQINTSRTRGHNQKIYKKHCRLNIRKYSFSQRVVVCWNTHP